MFFNNDAIDIIYLYLLEDPNMGYVLTFSYQNNIKEVLISDCKIFDKKKRKQIVNKITFDDINKVIDIDLLEEEKLDLLNKLKGNY